MLLNAKGPVVEEHRLHVYCTDRLWLQ